MEELKNNMNLHNTNILTLAFHEMLNSHCRCKDMRELHEVGMVDQQLIDDYEEYERVQELNFINKLFTNGTL